MLLRRWEDSDLPAFFDLYSRQDVARWLGQHPRRALASLDEARERLRHWHVLEQRLDPPLGRWAIVPLARFPRQDKPVGTIPLLPVTDPRGPSGQVEVGWHLHPDHQGQGLVTEAAGAILAAAAKAGIEQVIALTDPDNIPSQAVAARLGMHDEGLTQRWYGLTSRQYHKITTEAGEGRSAR